MGTILIIDSDLAFSRDLCNRLNEMGYDGIGVQSLNGALRLLKTQEVDVIFYDQDLPDGNGVSGIGKLANVSLGAGIIILATTGDPDSVDKALSSGAEEYLVKPIASDTLKMVIDHFVKRKCCNPHCGSVSDIRRSIIGDSPALKVCLNKILLSAKGKSNVLLTGETGTGKELFARALHQASSCHNGRFVVVDCTNLPDTLAESLLFGHEKGAFTGAFESREGLFKLADGGTIFLDEIGDLNPSIQKVLLRVLQEKTFRPLSAKEEVQSSFRLVAATNRNMPKMVQQGSFRKDLYYRLQSIVIDLPPLRKRNGDIKKLVEFYLEKVLRDNELSHMKYSPEFIEGMCSYDWPGNVRELVNGVHEAVHMATLDGALNFCHLPMEVKKSYLKKRHSQRAVSESYRIREPFICDYERLNLPKFKQGRREVVDKFESGYLARLLETSDYSTKKACMISGVSRTRLYELLNKHKIRIKRCL